MLLCRQLLRQLPLLVMLQQVLLKSRPMAIAVQSVRLGIVAFVLPFMFVYQPSLLMQGTFSEVIVSMITAVIGAYFLAIAMEGWFRRRLLYWERVSFGLVGLISIYPGMYTDIVGFVMGALLMIYIYRRTSTSTVNKAGLKA